MITYLKGNLLDSDCEYICHQVNCQGVMGAGIAKQIRERWPKVFASYHNYCTKYDRDANTLLGNIWGVSIGTQWIVNMFAQDAWGYGGRFTSYDAFAECLDCVQSRLPKGSIIGFPKNIGCGLGGGNWKVISALIEEILGDDYDVRIYEYEP